MFDIIDQRDEILKEEQEKIFERFYCSAKSKNKNFNRYRLGLTIAKNIVINHGGTIESFSKNNFITFQIVFK